MEAASYAESHGLPKEDLTAVAKAMACLPKKNTARPRTVIITQGTDPTIVAIGKGEGEVEVKTFDVHAIGEEQINDTNGAGYVVSPSPRPSFVYHARMTDYNLQQRCLRRRLHGRHRAGQAPRDVRRHGTLARQAQHTGAGPFVSVAEADVYPLVERHGAPSKALVCFQQHAGRMRRIRKGSGARILHDRA